MTIEDSASAAFEGAGQMEERYIKALDKLMPYVSWAHHEFWVASRFRPAYPAGATIRVSAEEFMRTLTKRIQRSGESDSSAKQRMMDLIFLSVRLKSY